MHPAKMLKVTGAERYDSAVFISLLLGLASRTFAGARRLLFENVELKRPPLVISTGAKS